MKLETEIAKQIFQLQLADVCIGSGKINLLATLACRLYQLLKLDEVLPCRVAICILAMFKESMVRIYILVGAQHRVGPQLCLLNKSLGCIYIIVRRQQGRLLSKKRLSTSLMERETVSDCAKATTHNCRAATKAASFSHLLLIKSFIIKMVKKGCQPMFCF